MSAVEVRTLARVVIEAGGGLDDLKVLVARWEAGVRLSPVAPCGCHRRTREWRLRGQAVDVVCTYLSGKAYRAAAARSATERRRVIAKGPASGWVWETTPLDHGHPWTCALCHPPAGGLDVEYRESEPLEGDVVNPDGQIAGRLVWRPGYGWRRDGQLDGDQLPPVVEPPDDRFKTKPKVNHAYVDPNAPLIADRYSGRPEAFAAVERNIQAWERLCAMATEPSIYAEGGQS